MLEPLNQQLIIQNIVVDHHPLLSLEPPSCIVALIRDFGNKSLLFTLIMHLQHNLQLPTVCLTSYTGISDIFSEKALDNYDKVRDRTTLSKL